eukprot:g6085.t1
MSHAFVSSRKRSFHQIEGSESEELSPDGCTHFFETYLRGARHHNTETLQVNDVLSCIKEPSNPADPNAIALHQRIEDGPIKVGYFSRELAAQLAPLMDLDCLSIEVTVLSKENRNKIRIQVALQGRELQSMIPELIHLANSNERGEFTNRVLCQNLSLLLETVSSQNPHLLHRCEKDTYLELRNLDRVSLCVLLRLYLRKGTWFRVRRLDYFNIELLEDRVNDLVTNELLESSSSLGVVATMTVEEMKIFLKDRKRTEWKLRLTGNKHQLVSETTRLLQEYPQLIDELQSNFGRAVRVHGRVKCALQVAERLYFLDEVHDLSSFLTAELDLVRWPQYQIQIQQKVFPDRNSFDSYFTSMNELTDLESWIKMNDDQSIEGLLGVVWKRLESGEHKKLNWSSNGTISCLPNPLPVHEVSNKTPLFLARFTSIWITVKLATVGVAYLEKRKQYKLAIEKLRTLLGGNCCPFSRGHWWNRLIINLKHLKKFTLALEACNCALSDNWVRHGSLYSIKRHYLKLSRPPRRWKRPTWASQVDESIKMTRIEASPLERVPGCKSQFRGRTGVVSVEQLALEYYQDHGDWRGVYTEGTLWTTLFGVLFWDVIFSGQFTHFVYWMCIV